MQTTLAFALVLVGTSALTILATLLIAGGLRRIGTRADAAVSPGGDAAFLFDGPVLIDTNARGGALLDSLRQAEGDDCPDWQRLTRFLARDFADLDTVLAKPPHNRPVRLTGADARGVDLTVEGLDGMVRLTLIDTLAEDGGVTLDRLSFRAMYEELALLRQMTEAAPLLLWREGAQGQVTWANRAYLQRLAESGDGGALTWPLPTLFPVAEAGPARRIGLAATASAPAAWFDITRVRDADGMLVYALPADEAYQAERTKRDFIQTLTKTFATLPIGLAVFDRTRRLQMFNPALTDLTALEPEFLLSRPGIEGFLNRMRDKHVLPEPRDYRSWSRRLLDIETTAPAGGFEETWSLPTGQTYRVSVNPHPDGALAFLIEDITTETHLTRNVRAEMETSQSVLNQIDDAIAVFAPNGQLVLTNTAFSRLWTLEGEESMGAVTLPDALQTWADSGDDPDLWKRIGALARPGKASPLPERGVMRMPDSEALTVEARRTSTGALMIAFAQDAAPAATSARAQVLRATA